MHRRQFLKTAAAVGAGLLILPSGARAGKNAPGNKLNIALIGVWGRGLAHYDSLADENVVALCDVNEKRFPDALKRFPKRQDLRRLAEVPGSKRPRRGGHLHGRPHPRLRRQLGAQPRPARLLREAAGDQRRRSPRRAGELAEEERQAGHASRHAAARHAEFQPRARTDPRRRHRRAEGGLRLGQPPDPPPRLPARRRASRPKASTSISGSARRPCIPTTPAISPAGRGHELPVVEHVLGLRRRPDRRHGQPHHGPALERRRRHACRPRPKRRARSSIPTSRRWSASRTSSTRPTTGAGRSA